MCTVFSLNTRRSKGGGVCDNEEALLLVISDTAADAEVPTGSTREFKVPSKHKRASNTAIDSQESMLCIMALCC
jgi:hypothetical protein